jgi:hypothetical protein
MSDRDENRPIGISNDCVKRERTSIPWIWEGVVAESAITLLSGAEKRGKTTLLSLLLDRRREGGALLGRNVYPGKTIVCSEESRLVWALRQPPLDFGPGIRYHTPAGGIPSRGRWRRFISDIVSIDDDDFDLLVIDTAVHFLPLAQRNPRLLQWALDELRLCAPLGVLLLNQSRNVQRPLAAFADIVIEMTEPRAASAARRRIFKGVGRYPGVLQEAHAELNSAGTDYVLLPETPPPHPPLLTTLQALLRSGGALTRQQLLARWPSPAPCPETLWRTLLRGVQLGLFAVSGSGTKSDAYRYALSPPAPEAPSSPEPPAGEES